MYVFDYFLTKKILREYMGDTRHTMVEAYLAIGIKILHEFGLDISENMKNETIVCNCVFQI